MGYRDKTGPVDIFDALFTKAKQTSIFIFDTEGRVIDCNEVVYSMFGYTLEDIKGRYFDFLFTEIDKQRGKPEEELEKVLSTGQAFDNNYIVHKQGYFKWVNGESMLLKNDKGENTAIIKTIFDLNEQKRLVQLLEDSTDFTENIFDTIPGSLLILDNNDHILQANRYFYNEFQLLPEQVEQISLYAMVGGQFDLAELRDLLKTVNTNSFSFKNFEISINFKEKGPRVMNLNAKRIHLEETKVQRTLLGIEDITERREIETRKDDFMSMASHELKTPITSLKAYLQLLERELNENGSSKSGRYVKKSTTQIERLEQLVAELLDVAKIRAGKLQLNLEAIDLDHLVTEIVESQQLISEHRIIITGNTGKKIKGDKARLEQVLINLLSNAIKYSPKAKEVHVLLSVTEQDRVQVSVQDFGIGIPKDKIHNIFDRFFRAETSSKFQGLGIGLFIVKEIIERHKGKIEIESTHGEGSVFTITLPSSPESNVQQIGS